MLLPQPDKSAEPSDAEPPFPNAASRLNHDILINILERIADPRQRDSKYSVKPAARTILSASHVNTWWRATSIGHPPLWSKVVDPDHHKPEWVSILLARSVESGLFIISDGMLYTEPKHDGAERTWGLLLQEFHRCVYLCVRIDWKGTPSLYSLLWLPAPRLLECSISGPSARLRTKFPYIISSIDSPPLFADNAPNLRLLQLIDCQISTAVPLRFPGMEQISSISSCGFLTTAPFVHLFTVKTLILTEFGFYPSSPRKHSLGSFPEHQLFPELQSLYLTGTLAWIKTVLRCTEIPAKCNISLDVRFVTRVGTDTIEAFWSAVAPNTNGGFPLWNIRIEETSLDIMLTEGLGRFLRIRFSLGIKPPYLVRDSKCDQIPGLPKLFHWRRSPYPFFVYNWSLLGSLYPSLVTSATTVVISSTTICSFPDYLPLLFSKMHQVRSLRFDQATASGILQYRDKGFDTDHAGRNLFPFAALKLLSVPPSVSQENLDSIWGRNSPVDADGEIVVDYSVMDNPFPHHPYV